MRPTELDTLRKKAESAADVNSIAGPALAAIERQRELVEQAERMSDPFTKDLEALRSPSARAIDEMRAARDRVNFDVGNLEPRPVVVVPSPEGEMVGHIAAMRKELAESNRREAESMKRAEEAELREQETQRRGERRERWTVAIAAVALLCTVIALIPVALLIF